LNYAVLDVESTGGSPKRERIIEIAIIKTDGKKILDSYQSLVNPEKIIPPFVCKLTGISNEMVETAPTFEEIASQIKDFTENCILVAHNAFFDYGFLKSEFKYVGEYYQRQRLCTVKFAQRIVPDLPGYSLTKLTDHFGIVNESVHRAYGDTLATTHLFHKLLQLSDGELLDQLLRRNYVNHLDDVKIPEEQIETLPDETGLLNFHNNKKELIYTTRASDVYQRMTDMLFYYKKETHKGNMLRNATSISYNHTGSELLAQLLEIETINKNKPSFNRKSYSLNYVTKLEVVRNKFGYDELKIVRKQKVEKSGYYFANRYEAESVLGKLIRKNKLCPAYAGQAQNKNNSCDFFKNKLCNGACQHKEEPAEYNKRVKAALRWFNYKHKSFILLDEGPKHKQKVLFLIENNRCLGYTIVDVEENFNIDNIDEVKERLTPFCNHPIINQTIRKYIFKKKYEKLQPIKLAV